MDYNDDVFFCGVCGAVITEQDEKDYEGMCEMCYTLFEEDIQTFKSVVNKKTKN